MTQTTDKSRVEKLLGNLSMKVSVRDLHEGSEIPLFYLPVRVCLRSYAIEAWIFPLAPFVLIYRVITSMFWAIWADLNEFIGLQKHKRKD